MKKFTPLFLTLALIAIPTAIATSTVFSDIPTGEWYEEAVYNLYEKGIIEGYPDDTYQPASNMNRAELATVLDRFMEYEREQKIERVKCLDSLIDDNLEEGMILLTANKEMSDDEITGILEDDYGLTDYERIVFEHNDDFLYVEVTEGMEIEWVCLFKEDERFNSVHTVVHDTVD